MTQVYVTFSTDGFHLLGAQAPSPNGPWLNSGEDHCRKLLGDGGAKPVGAIAEEIFAIAQYQRIRDKRADALRTKTGWPMTKVLPAIRQALAEDGVPRPKNAPVWL